MTEPKLQNDRQAELAQAISAGDFQAARRILAAPGAAGKPDKPHVGRISTRDSMSLAEACGGCDTTVAVGGKTVHYHTVRRTLDQWLGDVGPTVQREYVSVLRGARQRMDELAASPALCHAANAAPEDLLLVSPWQWGVTDPVLSLIGVMFCQDARLIVEHYVAPDERAEGAICQAFADRCARAGVMVTFSAKRSHRKCLADRCALHGVDLSAEAWDAPASRVRAGQATHLDLRKESRTRWCGQFRSTSLPFLERSLFARSRSGLIPPAAARQAYRDFAATGDAAAMGDVLTHCAADLATMAQLVCVLLTGCEDSGE